MLSKYTIGTVQFGVDYGINNKTGKPEVEKCIEILEYAYIHGIKSIDTATVYGNSEKIIGKWVDRYNHSDIFITSKIRSLTDLNVKESDVNEYVRSQVYSSLERLNVNKLDNIMIHDFSDIEVYGNVLIDALLDLKEEGIIENYGCSIYDLKSIKTILKSGFNTIQFPGSIFNQSILESDELKLLKRNGVKTFVRSPFVQGLLFMKSYEIPDQLSDVREYIVELENLKDNYQLTTTEIALNYLNNNENVDSVVFGVDSLKQLKEIINVDKSKMISKKVITERFSKIPRDLIDPRNWRF